MRFNLGEVWIRLAPKAAEVLHRYEMTRRAAPKGHLGRLDRRCGLRR